MCDLFSLPEFRQWVIEFLPLKPHLKLINKTWFILYKKQIRKLLLKKPNYTDIEHCSNLTHLVISLGMNKISSFYDSLKTHVEHCNIKTLEFTDCMRLPLKRFTTLFPQLQTLIIDSNQLYVPVTMNDNIKHIVFKTLYIDDFCKHFSVFSHVKHIELITSVRCRNQPYVLFQGLLTSIVEKLCGELTNKTFNEFECTIHCSKHQQHSENEKYIANLLSRYPKFNIKILFV